MSPVYEGVLCAGYAGCHGGADGAGGREECGGVVAFGVWDGEFGREW